MNPAPLVSVIVPNFNHAAYLPARLDSILTQTYRNFEVLLLDDCSSDNSVEVLNTYRDNPHVSAIIVNEKNSGSTFRQWNLGFRYAKGDIIWIAESDDSCSQNLLETLVAAYRSVPGCAIAYCATQWIDMDGQLLPTPVKYRTDATFTGADFIRQRLDVGTDIWNASSAIFSKSLAEMIPDDYKQYRNTGDHLFWLELARCEGASVAFIHEPLNYCRQHGNNVTARKDRYYNIFAEEKRIFDIQVKYGYIRGLKKYHVIDRYRTMILTKEFCSEDDRARALETWRVRGRVQWAWTKLLACLYRLTTNSRR